MIGATLLEPAIAEVKIAIFLLKTYSNLDTNSECTQHLLELKFSCEFQDLRIKTTPKMEWRSLVPRLRTELLVYSVTALKT
jgi:hypothetical protein